MTSSATGGGQQALNLDLPAPPAALVQMMQLLQQPDCDLDALRRLMETDMALAAALLRSVNSSLFSLKGRIQTVREALTFLGSREVAAIALQHALRSMFPPTPELEQVWERSARRGQHMANTAQALGFHAWAAHSAGLFEECGKALLMRHAPERYRELWCHAGDDDSLLVSLEMDAFGASHDIVGAALCETWGLQPSAVHCVRHHVIAQSTLRLPGPIAHRQLGALSVLAQRLASEADDLAEAIDALAPQIDVPVESLRALIQPQAVAPLA